MSGDYKPVTNQAEFDAVVAAGDYPEIANDGCYDISRATWIRVSPGAKPHVEASGSSQPHVEASGSSQPHVVARESSQPHVVAWGSSQPHVEARGSSQPHVVAWGSSQPHVEASGSSQPHVVAWGSSQPHVVAWGSSHPHVVARESSQPHVVATQCVQLAVDGHAATPVAIKASADVAVAYSGKVAVEGAGFVREYKKPQTAEEWCAHYGVEVTDGVAVLFKALEEDWRGSHKTKVTYEPGSIPAAPDWDPEPECGGGLHFSPRPIFALDFCERATRFVACPVSVAEIVVHPDGQYPAKVKAPRCAAPVWEVTRWGARVEPPPVVEPKPKKRARKEKAS